MAFRAVAVLRRRTGHLLKPQTNGAGASPRTCGAVISPPTSAFPGGQEIGGTASFDDILDKVSNSGRDAALRRSAGRMGHVFRCDLSQLQRRHDPGPNSPSIGDLDTGYLNSPPPIHRVGQEQCVSLHLRRRTHRRFEPRDHVFCSGPMSGRSAAPTTRVFTGLHGRWPVHAPFQRSLAVERAGISEAGTRIRAGTRSQGPAGSSARAL